MDNGIEQVADEDIKRQLRRQARRVYIESILAALALTVLLLLPPG